MRFFSPAECVEWCSGLQVALEDQRPSRDLPQPHRLRCNFPASFTQLLWFSRTIETAIQPRNTCLLWVTDWSIFPSNENYHLYYRLRQSYSDLRLLHEAPGHLCLDYERPEVVTLLHLCILFGWDVHLIPSVGYARAFISHDGWLQIGFDDVSQMEQTKQTLAEADLEVFV